VLACLEFRIAWASNGLLSIPRLVTRVGHVNNHLWCIALLATSQPTHSPWTVYQIIWRYDEHDTTTKRPSSAPTMSRSTREQRLRALRSSRRAFCINLSPIFHLRTLSSMLGTGRRLPAELKIAVTDPDWWKSLWDAEAFLVYFGWYAFCLVAWAILANDWVSKCEMA